MMRIVHLGPFEGILMMNLDRLDMVNRYAEARQALLHQITVIEQALDSGRNDPRCVSPFCMTIDGTRLDEPMVALVRPVILTELRARVRRIDADLAQLGVATS
jgi:hypothetical protein